MQKKHGKYYADWRDEAGRRHRKALPTKKRALTFQRQRQAETLAGKAHASGPSGKSARRGPRQHHTTTPAK